MITQQIAQAALFYGMPTLAGILLATLDQDWRASLHLVKRYRARWPLLLWWAFTLTTATFPSIAACVLVANATAVASAATRWALALFPDAIDQTLMIYTGAVQLTMVALVPLFALAYWGFSVDRKMLSHHFERYATPRGTDHARN